MKFTKFFLYLLRTRDKEIGKYLRKKDALLYVFSYYLKHEKEIESIDDTNLRDPFLEKLRKYDEERVKIKDLDILEKRDLEILREMYNELKRRWRVKINLKTF